MEFKSQFWIWAQAPHLLVLWAQIIKFPLASVSSSAKWSHNNTYFAGLLGRWYSIMHVKCSVQCKDSITVTHHAIFMHLIISSQQAYEVGKAAVIMLINLNTRKPDLQVVIDLSTTTQDGELLILSITGVSELLAHCLPFTHSAMWCCLLMVP